MTAGSTMKAKTQPQVPDVPRLPGKIRHALGSRIYNDTRDMETVIDYLMIVKYLERIGDHAVNICEWVHFYVTGVHINQELPDSK